MHIINALSTIFNSGIYLLKQKVKDEKKKVMKPLLDSYLSCISYSHFSFQPVFHDWRNKGCDMCYTVCGMVHIK